MKFEKSELLKSIMKILSKTHCNLLFYNYDVNFKIIQIKDTLRILICLQVVILKLSIQLYWPWKTQNDEKSIISIYYIIMYSYCSPRDNCPTLVKLFCI